MNIHISIHEKKYAPDGTFHMQVNVPGLELAQEVESQEQIELFIKKIHRAKNNAVIFKPTYSLEIDFKNDFNNQGHLPKELSLKSIINVMKGLKFAKD